MITINSILLFDLIEKSRILTMSNSSLKCFILYRENIEELLDNFPELQLHCMYILLGEESRLEKRQCYIGQTLNGYNRIKLHIKQKDFWEIACLFFNTKEEFSKSEVQYLEYLAIKNTIECNNYNILENCQIPIEPVLNNLLKDKILEDFNNIKLLLLFSNFLLFNIKIFNLDNITKKNNHTIVSRIANIYKKTTEASINNLSELYNDYDVYTVDDEEIHDNTIYYLHNRPIYEAQAMRLSDNLIFLFGYGYINMNNKDGKRLELIDKAIQENKLNKNTFSILSSIIFDNKEDAELFVTGSIENKWLPKIND